MRKYILTLAALFVIAPVAVSQQASPGADALLLYQRGRDLEAAGKTAEAEKSYQEAVAVCDAEIAANPGRMDSYVVKSWCQSRLKRHADVVATGLAALKVATDYRIIETMGESYFYLGDMLSSLRYLQRYVDSVPENSDRVSTAYFFMGEAYLNLRRYEHADISYTIAVHKTPGFFKWWYRLGMAKEGAGDLAGALAAYEESIKRSPSFSDAVVARDRVKALIPR